MDSMETNSADHTRKCTPRQAVSESKSESKLESPKKSLIKIQKAKQTEFYDNELPSPESKRKSSVLSQNSSSITKLEKQGNMNQICTPSITNPPMLEPSNPIDGFRKVTHCILELDGIMINTGPIYANVYKRLVAEYDREFPRSLHLRLMGTNYMRRAEIIVPELKLPLTPLEFMNKFQYKAVEAVKYLPINLMQGAKRLVYYLATHKIPFCLATGNPEFLYEFKIKRNAEVFSYFCHHVCGETDPDVVIGKPAPDLFLVAASRFRSNPDPSQCLVFDKAPNGKKAALSAGMQVAMLPDPGVPDEDCIGATEVLRSLWDFKPEKYGMPKFKTGLY